MTKLIHELTYPDVTLAQVAEMLAEPAYREAVCDAQRATEKHVEVTPVGAGMQVVIHHVHATHAVPGFARRIVGDRVTLHSVEDWTSADNADLHITVPGKPGHMNGTIRLHEDGTGVTERVDLEIHVPVPLVGGKIESLLADLLAEAFDIGHTVGRSWLGHS